MKKSILAFAMAGIFLSALHAQQITVTSPGGGEWYLGTTYTIAWTSSGVAGPVSIKLRLAGAPDAPPVLSISDSSGNDGLAGWTIPASVAPGNYLVRVRTVGNDPLVYGDSAVFAISAQPVGFTFLYPHRPVITSWWRGNSYRILWTSNGPTGDRVHIELRDRAGIKTIAVIAASAPNSGSCDWTIHNAFPEGEYLIRINSLSNPTIVGRSGLVVIRTKDCGTLMSLSRTSGYEGDLLTLYGRWAPSQGERCPVLVAESGSGYQPILVSWSADAIQVKVYTQEPGPHRVMVRCVCDNRDHVSNALDFMLLGRPTDFIVRIGGYADGRLQVHVANQTDNAYYCPFDIKLVVAELGHSRVTIFPATLFLGRTSKTYSLLFPAWPQGRDCLQCQVVFDSMGRVTEIDELNNEASEAVCRGEN